jgi:Pyruvate/2-oxoacid:ferredoxin oxidoreductase gamma subunit
MVALGALIRKTNLLDMDQLKEVVRSLTKNATQLELNLLAIEAGFEYANANDECSWGV